MHGGATLISAGTKGMSVSAEGAFPSYWRNLRHIHFTIQSANAFALSVFLFAATNAQVRLVYFQFGQNYLEYLEASDEHEQLRLIHDKTMDTFAHMHSTKWFDISKEDGRRAVLCQVLALVQWYTATHGSDDDGSNDDMEDWG